MRSEAITTVIPILPMALVEKPLPFFLLWNAIIGVKTRAAITRPNESNGRMMNDDALLLWIDGSGAVMLNWPWNGISGGS